MNDILKKSEGCKSEYCCTCVKIGEIHPIEGKDKIGYTIVNGETIVIRKDQVEEGNILFYASNETQLNKDFLSANNLFESSCCELNSNFEEVKPYVEKNKEFKTKLDELVKASNKLTSCVNFLMKYDAELTASMDDEDATNTLNERYERTCKTVITLVKNGHTLDIKTCSLNDFIIAAQKELETLNIEIDALKSHIDENMVFIKSHVGFFNKTGRVCAIRLGGIRSMGYLFTLDELAKYKPIVKDVNVEELVGEDFDTVDGELFIKAYVPKVKEQKVRKKSEKRDKIIERFDRMIKGEFSFHYDTQMFARNVNLFKPTDKVTITNKLHGCVERNTIINTLEYGDLIIGDIVSKKIDCHIKAYDTDINEIVYVPIDNFYTIPNDGEWYEIELENGKKITITGNNPIWLPELGVYRRVDELNGDEKILFSDT